ncbi:hypothetical protein [Streptomyces sp. NEAU-S77]|uniref:hypothetical protein n=1 Tax=Streptomyces sp. NEAU-S77 TaxID=3411033 RepID=UPI003BA06E61
MGQEAAAIFAAVIGLLGALGGALVGGYAAVRGAREGAERTARAALEQAARQAQDQFEHWLRQERRTAYAEVLQNLDDFQMKLANMVSCTGEPNEVMAALEAMEDVVTSHLQLIRRMGHLVTIAGPRVRSAYADLVQESERTCKFLTGHRPPDIPVDEIRSCYESVVRHGAVLTVLVADEVQTGPAGTS